MKYWTLIGCIFFWLSPGKASAQDFKKAGEYFGYISQQHKEIAKDVLTYSGAIAHGKSAKKVESKRQAVLQSIQESTKRISAMPPFEEDKSLRDSTVAYLKTAFLVMNNEYEKILNMEEIAEQSYDAMETYLLAQELADKHMNKAEHSENATVKEFAAKHKITLSAEDHDEIHEKLKITSQVNAYHRMVYLVFFKSNKQEVYLVDAITKKNLSAVEQNKSVLSQYVEDGLKKLDTMKAYQNDRSLVLATKQMLEFYQNECTNKIPILSNFLIKEEEMAKTKKAFDAKKDTERTKEEVNEYNKAINEFNTLVGTYNTTIKGLNQERTKVLTDWDKTSSSFLDKHVP
jgi:hypothetical protein